MKTGKAQTQLGQVLRKRGTVSRGKTGSTDQRPELRFYPLDHRKATIQAGLVWPIEPYRLLGQAYCRAFKRKLKTNSNFRFPALTPSSEEEWTEWLELPNNSAPPKALTSPLGRWLLIVQGMIDRQEYHKTIRVLAKGEDELKKKGSSLEELIIFDHLIPLLMAKNSLDIWAKQEDRFRDFRIRQVRSLEGNFRFIKEALEKEVRGDPSITRANDLLSQAIEVLRPPLPSAEKPRKRALQQALHKWNRPPFPKPPLYQKVRLFHDVIVVAVRLCRLRGFQAIFANNLLAEILPCLFPRALFPERTYPIPTTAVAVQHSYSRSHK